MDFALLSLADCDKPEAPGNMGLHIVFEREPPEFHHRSLTKNLDDIVDRFDAVEVEPCSPHRAFHRAGNLTPIVRFLWKDETRERAPVVWAAFSIDRIDAQIEFRSFRRALPA